ncbi:MAG: transposase, partial [Eggerthellaceae bacterium]|nr:transposase [Eggerthellaceae bacterium]
MRKGDTIVRGRRKQSESGIYHVVSRGAGHCIIFEDNVDRTRFLEELVTRFEPIGALIHAWCLMSNHYHLLVQVELDCLASAMKALNSSYAQYFNKRHGRIGYLFQGRFKSEPINDDAYFLTALRYIHKNPQKAGICRADEYRWSSYQEYIGRNAVAGMAAIAKTDLGLSMLGGIEAFREFHATAGDSESCLDLETGRRIVTDDDAMAIARAA